MTISILTALVVAESFIILFFLVIYLLRKNSKLKKVIDDLLTTLSESLFSKLVSEEIEKTNEYINEVVNSDNIDEFDLSSTLSETDSNNEKLKKLLTFRSSYLHAEINAYDSSDGNQELFWHYLAENIESLIPNKQQPTDETPTEPEYNEFINEIMQELQDKLEKSTESNISLQALLDSLLNDGKLAADQIQTIKKSQADFFDLSHNVSDLENKLQNSLNIEITGQPGKPDISTSEKTLIIEKTGNNVNTEVNKLKDIIYNQGEEINGLIRKLKEEALDNISDNELFDQLDALEKSQKETAMCLNVLEMENQRLMEEIETLEYSADNESLKIKISELENIIKDKDNQYQQLKNEFKSIEQEFLAVYKKDAK